MAVVIGEYSFDPSKQIGKGRNSTVYEGHHVEKGLKVAVKKVDWSTINKSKHDTLVKKLQQALGIQKTKNYEHVLTLYDFKEVEESSYIIYELCDDTLENYLGSAALTEEAALDLLKQVVAIVFHKFATAHKVLLNRDVSPQNLLVSKTPNGIKLKFADFALAQFAEDKSLHWPSYLAPEILSKQEFIDKRKAEVFSLGLTLYRLLVGKLPYNSQSELDEELSKETPFASADDIPEITDHTKNLLKRSLQVQPDNRMPLPSFLKKFGFDLPEPGSLRFSSSQADLSTELLLLKIEEATEEIVNLKERIRRLEAEKLESEMQMNLRLEQGDRDAHEQVEKLNEELQVVRQELSDALEQILRSDEQYDALDTRKRTEIADLMHQLVMAHETLEEVARKTQEELVTYKRTIEELKDNLESKQEEIHDIKKEHEMVELFRQEELSSLKRELDDLTELFVQIEQSRREDDDRATARYDEMVRQKDLEIAELRKGGAKLAPNGVSNNAKPHSTTLRPSSPDVTPLTKSWSSSASRPLSPSPAPSPVRPSSTSPEPSSPRGHLSAQAKTWTAPAYTPKPATTSPSPTPPKWTPPPKTVSPVPTVTTTTAPAPAKWTPPPKTASPAPASGSTAGQKPAWITSSKPSPAAAASTSSPAASTTTATTAAAATTATYAGPLFSAAELRGMLKNPSSAFDGFDKTQIEQYLDEGEFQQLLGTSKAEYNKLPKWKQAPLKSKAKLF